MAKMNFKYFKKQLTNLFVFMPEERPDWEEWMHEWYVTFKECPYHNDDELEEWANEWFLNHNLKDHSFMLKSIAKKERDRMIAEGLLDREALRSIRK